MNPPVPPQNDPETLTPMERDILSNSALALGEVGLKFHKIDKDRTETSFELGLRIKKTLDELETRPIIPRNNDHLLALIINCEIRLYCLYSDMPLRHNPFLCHWVEAVQRLDHKPARLVPFPYHALSLEETNAVRVLWIKTLLQGENFRPWLGYSPTQVYDSLLKEGLSKPFDIRPFIQMLIDEGIYDTDDHVSYSVAQLALDEHDDDSHTVQESIEQSQEDTIQKEKDAILQKLEKQPNEAILEITRLPIAIPYLEFITTLLTDRTLENHSIDPAPIITQYIQHALRIVERAEKPPSPTVEAEADTDGPRADGAALEYGKEAQTRYIRLLLLFIKSLIRKGLVELDVLYYEIAEITVRYVWIKEVRDFRSWAEEGDEDNGADG